MKRTRVLDRDKIQRDFHWVRTLSVLLDSKFRIGKFSFGLDPILNFIPFAGQGITFITSVLLVLIMYKNGVSSKAAAKMLINSLVDAAVGAIPIFGNVYDFFNKANQKNIKLLEEHYYEGKHQGSATKLLFGILIVLLLCCVLMLYLLWVVGKWTLSLF